MLASGSTVNKRTPLARLPQQALALLLAQSGYSFSLIADAIAEHTGTQLSTQQIGFDIATVLDKHRPIAPTDPDEIRILQIARLEMIANLAFQAFLDSATVDVDTNTTTDAPDAEGKPTQRKTRSRSRKRSAGDAKYLAIMQGVEVERSKILGAYAPERREEVGELTVTFAWRDTPQQPAIGPPDATDASYRLADSTADDDPATLLSAPAI